MLPAYEHCRNRLGKIERGRGEESETNHDVIIVPVTNAEDVGGNTIARAREGEIVDGLLVGFLGGVACSQPVSESGGRVRRTRSPTAKGLGNSSSGLGIRDHLDDTQPIACADCPIRLHMQIQSLILP